MKRIFLFLIVFCGVGLASAAEPAPGVSRRPAGESFQDAGTGLVFPSQAGAYFKTEVRLHADPRIGVTVRFQNEDSAYADVYLYRLDEKGAPVTEAAFSAECAAVGKKILTGWKQERLTYTVKTVPETARELPPGVFSRLFEIRLENENFRSRLTMFLYRGTVVKCRITYPADDPGEAEDAARFEQLILVSAGLRKP